MTPTKDKAPEAPEAPEVIEEPGVEPVAPEVPKVISLASGVMPKSNVGRKAIEVDAALLDALIAGFGEKTWDQVDDDLRAPVFYGPNDRKFTTESRATSDGRRYQKALKAEGLTTKVNVYPDPTTLDFSVKEEGTVTKETRYLWRLYVPLSVSESEV